MLYTDSFRAETKYVPAWRDPGMRFAGAGAGAPSGGSNEATARGAEIGQLFRQFRSRFLSRIPGQIWDRIPVQPN